MDIGPVLILMFLEGSGLVSLCKDCMEAVQEEQLYLFWSHELELGVFLDLAFREGERSGCFQ